MPLPDQESCEGQNQLRGRQQVQVPQRRQNAYPDVAEGIEGVDDPLGKVCDQVLHTRPLLFHLRRGHSVAYLTSSVPEHSQKNLP